MHEHRDHDGDDHHAPRNEAFFQPQSRTYIRPQTLQPVPPPRDDVVVETDDQMLTIQAAARQAGVSRAAVLSWIRNGFIDAHTSSNGWVVRSGDIENARRSADDARRGLTHDPDEYENPPERASDAARIDESTSAILPRAGNGRQPAGQLGDSFFAPLAEFVRDQADVVQEQAETIGWLQAELRRAREQVAAYEATSAAARQKLQSEESERPVTAPEPAAAVNELEPELPDPFTNVHQVSSEQQRDGDLSFQYNVIAEDPFSDEAARAREMIEETERTIMGMWNDQEEQRTRHTQTASHTTEELSWLKWLTSPWKRREP